MCKIAETFRNMLKTISCLIAFLLSTYGCYADNYNNSTQEYEISSKTSSAEEAFRMQRRIIADYHPTGLYVKSGQKIEIQASAFSNDYQLSLLVGFKPLWGGRNKQQEIPLVVGVNNITTQVEGMLFLIFTKKNGYDNKPEKINITIKGGTQVPFYYDGITTELQWKEQLQKFNKAPFIQLASDQIMINIPYEDYIKTPIKSFRNTFDQIHKIVEWANEVSGFYGNSEQHSPTKLRIHFIVDTHFQNGDGYYMYTSNYLIGIKRDNFQELIDPDILQKNGWGIWHELGHTYQQPYWRWGGVGEITVNIYSLYIQEKFGNPTPFAKPNSAKQGLTLFQNAERYFNLTDKNYNNHLETDNNPLFTKMMLFWQLKQHYGWKVFQLLHRYVREHPLRDAGEDEVKINRFVKNICEVTHNDLRCFFERWGLKFNAETNTFISAQKYNKPNPDPSTYLKDPWKSPIINTKQLAQSIFELENKYRIEKGLKPYKYSTLIANECLYQCEDMKAKNGFTYGRYIERYNNIKKELGSKSAPNFNMLVNTDGNPETIFSQWQALKEKACLDSNYQYIGIGILQDTISNDNFYFSQFMAKDTASLPNEIIKNILRIENDYRLKKGLKAYTLKPELTLAAEQHAIEIAEKKALTFGKYLDRYNIIRQKMGQSIKPELHMTISNQYDANQIVQDWLKDNGGPNQNLNGKYQYTGFGIIEKNGKYYIVQYFAYDNKLN